ncbi:MAG: AmmeMemoRadiSam system protein B [Chloroflexi bacterium]|nr:AmmeMemoRadiSam system protein B [Chloroflexota bacterium]MBU1661620.1 AmmeMemoRadiSam system protein B [Chloroflexota bacterium]
MNTPTDLRPSPIAGQWYPGDPGRLAASVDSYLDAAALPEIEGEVIAVVAPHAGHIYSGPVAGYAFAALRGQTPELVAVISPMHHAYFQPLLTSGHEAYQTPLGPVPIDRDVVNALDEHLRAELGFGLTPVRNDSEHSLEIELPFLQRALAGDFALLPVMVRDQSVKVARSLGKALAQTLEGRSAILVASTDLSHFYPQRTANDLDKEMLRRIEAFDPEGVLRAEEQGKGFACGRGAVAAVLWAAQGLGADRVQILNYTTSGDVTGDHSQVVGYGSAVITR